MDRLPLGGGLVEPVAVRLTQSAMNDIQRTRERLAAEAPFTKITQADAIRYLIQAGSARVTA